MLCAHVHPPLMCTARARACRYLWGVTFNAVGAAMKDGDVRASARASNMHTPAYLRHAVLRIVSCASHVYTLLCILSRASHVHRRCSSGLACSAALARARGRSSCATRSTASPSRRCVIA